eukprot:TRINITY_DN58145_c0_g1_i1.p1 TRINITY_DN58145_c0_g1~~TRINITY_DN58145_c0_g1_i1.p1  ORF type:complete len:289 (-),score=67.81 TRINITY_DN58145_c0_g1_i1:58-861(-)
MATTRTIVTLAWMFNVISCKADTLDKDFAETADNALTDDMLHWLHGHMDKDKNGKLSLQELTHYVETMLPLIHKKTVRDMLAAMDTSKDGMVSLTELLDHDHNANDEPSDETLSDAKAKFIAADEDRNDLLDENELKGFYFADYTLSGVPNVALQRAFARKDADEDGKLTDKEFWEFEDNRVLSDKEVSDFKILDADMDDLLSIDEFRVWEIGHFQMREAMEDLFKIADKDKDNHVTKQELASARDHIGTSNAQFHLATFAVHHDEF